MSVIDSKCVIHAHRQIQMLLTFNVRNKGEKVSCKYVPVVKNLLGLKPPYDLRRLVFLVGRSVGWSVFFIIS